MCSSLHNATRIVAAAINAGFRESGVQSLKNLTDPNAFPMVAVRTSGLALESLIGYAYDDNPKGPNQNDGKDRICSLVSEQYLRILLEIANERFTANTERMQRFEHELFQRQTKGAEPWETATERAARKKVEGLARRSELQSDRERETLDDDDSDGDVLDLDLITMPSGYTRPSHGERDLC